jgi:EAL domain-containing protein (putative c-di-GMP-specific phosphodiesterase class I)
MSGLMRTVRARTRTFLAAGTVGVFVVIGVVAYLVGAGTAGVTRTDSDLRAARGVDLLVTVGPFMPDLTRSAITGGLSLAAASELDGALARAQHEGLLANLVVWDRSGRIVYSGVASSEGTRPPEAAELVAALAGHTVTRTHPRELEPSSGEPTGVLDAFQPLTDKRGRIYGAVEASLSLKSIDAAAGRSRDRSILFVIGGGVLIWLLLLPLWVRLARSQASDWVPGRRRTLAGVRTALDRGEIELVYQAQIDPASRRVYGVEALVRWRHNGQLLAPDRFLEAVESSPLMRRVTDRVLDLALAQLANWRRAAIVTRVSVNLSATDLADQSLPQRIAARLQRHGVAGQSVTVEVTETAILEDPPRAHLVLGALKRMGIDVALDDFGTGHASISRLHEFPVFSEVKIDRSFVSDTQQRSRTYLTAIIAFVRSLGLRVVAEGVEDAETLILLSTVNCDLAQGYYISRPLEPAAMTHWLTTAQPIPPPARASTIAASTGRSRTTTVMRGGPTAARPRQPASGAGAAS